ADSNRALNKCRASSVPHAARLNFTLTHQCALMQEMLPTFPPQSSRLRFATLRRSVLAPVACYTASSFRDASQKRLPSRRSPPPPAVRDASQKRPGANRVPHCFFASRHFAEALPPVAAHQSPEFLCSPSRT